VYCIFNLKGGSLFMKWLGILVMTALVASAPGYASAQQAGESGATPPPQPKSSQESPKPAPPAKSYTQEDRQAYEEKAAADLEAMQKKLEELRGKQRKVPVQSRRQVLMAMSNLQRGLSGAKAQLASMQKAPPESWGGLKANLDRAMATWNRDYADVAARLQ
jgi:hypothetical protein